SLPLVPPSLIVFDETVDHIVFEQLQVRVFSEGGLRVWEDLQVEGEDRAVQWILRRRGIRDVPTRDGSEPGELDRDRGLLALVREALERTDRVRLHKDPFILRLDRKSTRLNSSHDQISYAVFCLKKKKLLYSS